MTQEEAKKILSGCATWAREQSSVRAFALVGSWARDEARPDSDLDLFVLTNEKSAWVSHSGWMDSFAISLGFQVDKASLETYGVVASWRVWLGGEIELELTFGDVDWASVNPVDGGTRKVVEDGIRILIDKDDLLNSLMATVAS